MLRLLVLVLLLANGLYFAWGNGLLLPYGLGPVQQNEPQRMAQQITPEALRVLSAQELSRIEEQRKADQEPKECLRAGPLDAVQVVALRQALDVALPADAWRLEETPIAARWIVYLGKYPSQAAVVRKRAELAALKLPLVALDNPSLEPGISLGNFASKAEADSALVRLSARGLRTARVLQERTEGVAYALVLPALRASLKPKLAALQPALGSLTLRPCDS